eukprot:m.337924 g.337924  ORF g.337924 m.337924 type:complete len:51 (+) comp19809_c0_seq3:796-948(+)
MRRTGSVLQITTKHTRAFINQSSQVTGGVVQIMCRLVLCSSVRVVSTELK